METDQSQSVETCAGLSVATMEVQPPSLHCYIRKMQMNSITCFGDQRRPRSAHGLTPVLSTCSLSVTMWREQWQPVSKKTLWSPTEADFEHQPFLLLGLHSNCQSAHTPSLPGLASAQTCPDLPVGLCVLGHELPCLAVVASDTDSEKQLLVLRDGAILRTA